MTVVAVAVEVDEEAVEPPGVVVRDLVPLLLPRAGRPHLTDCQRYLV